MTNKSPVTVQSARGSKLVVIVCLLAALVICQAATNLKDDAEIYSKSGSSGQAYFSNNVNGAYVESPYHPRIDYAALNTPDDDDESLDLWPPNGMSVHALHVTGEKGERVNLMFFADGYTVEEEDKFIIDAQKLTDDIISENGAMGHVSHLLNVWGVYVPSKQSGIGTYDLALSGASFGLYRPGNELRAVYLAHHKRARKACAYFNTNTNIDKGYINGLEAGCDQPIILGNDQLYGGLGGEFTIITASKMNGPLVLRHELGHSLIPVGEEYEGGFAYFGANSDKVENLHILKWREYLSSPKEEEEVRIEDVKIPLQVYPWHDLDNGSYNTTFQSFNSHSKSNDSNSFVVEPDYPTALLRISLSSIPYPSHIQLTLNDKPINLSSGFSEENGWLGSLDRRWVEVDLPALEMGEIVLNVELSEHGKQTKPGQGGKILGSLEVVEYGGGGRFNHTKGFIGAFPTYAMDGSVTLRPTNEECLMRKVNHPTFCPICADALRESLEDRIERKRIKMDLVS